MKPWLVFFAALTVTAAAFAVGVYVFVRDVFMGLKF